MKAFHTKNTSLEKNAINEERPRQKTFPKISEIDPDKKKKKKKEILLETPINILLPQESSKGGIIEIKKGSFSLKNVMEIALPVITKIKLQKNQGITKTHFTIQTKRFGEVDIHLTMYDTAPHCFHLRLLGNEKIKELSMKYQNLLESSIKDALPRITIHIAPPALRKRDRFTLTKKKKSIVKTGSNCYGAVKGGRIL